MTISEGIQIWTEIELGTNPDPTYKVEETNWTMSVIVINQLSLMDAFVYGRVWVKEDTYLEENPR